MPETKEIKEFKDEITNLVTLVQSETEARKLEKGAFDETIENMKTKAAELGESMQKVTDELAGEVKSREELELAMSRMQETKEGEVSLSDPEYKQNFIQKVRMRTKGVDMDLMEKEVDRMVDFYTKNATDDEKMLIRKTLLVGSSPDTGYYVPVDMLVKITQRVFETSPMRQLSSVMTTANNSVTIGIDDQEADSGWRSEIAPVPETGTPKVGELEINTHELFAEPKASQRLLDDASVDMESWLGNKISSKFAREENSAFVNGAGSGTPRGFNTLPAWADPEVYERGKLANIAAATATLIEGDDLINLQAALLEEYQSGAVFGGHRLTWAQIVQLKDTTGQYLINPQLLFTGTTMQLLGVPFRFFGDLAKPVAGAYTAGQTPVVYGNFSEGYTIVDRMGIRIIRDNITEKGFVKWYTTKRTGGDVTNYQAIKRLEIV